MVLLNTSFSHHHVITIKITVTIIITITITIITTIIIITSTCPGYLQQTLASRANASQQGLGQGLAPGLGLGQGLGPTLSPLSRAHSLMTHPARGGGGGVGGGSVNGRLDTSNNNNNMHSTAPGQGLVVEILLLPLTLCVTVSDLALVSRVVQVTHPLSYCLPLPPPVTPSPPCHITHP